MVRPQPQQKRSPPAEEQPFLVEEDSGRQQLLSHPVPKWMEKLPGNNIRGSGGWRKVSNNGGVVSSKSTQISGGVRKWSRRTDEKRSANGRVMSRGSAGVAAASRFLGGRVMVG